MVKPAEFMADIAAKLRDTRYLEPDGSGADGEASVVALLRELEGLVDDVDNARVHHGRLIAAHLLLSTSLSFPCLPREGFPHHRRLAGAVLPAGRPSRAGGARSSGVGRGHRREKQLRLPGTHRATIHLLSLTILPNMHLNCKEAAPSSVL